MICRGLSHMSQEKDFTLDQVIIQTFTYFCKLTSTFISDFYNDDHLEYINKHWNKVLPYILHYNDVVPDNRLDSVSQKIRDEYLKGQELSKDTYHLLIKV